MGLIPLKRKNNIINQNFKDNQTILSAVEKKPSSYVKKLAIAAACAIPGALAWDFYNHRTTENTPAPLRLKSVEQQKKIKKRLDELLENGGSCQMKIGGNKFFGTQNILDIEPKQA
jgi:hypothetical protein